jgi:hypothetical protein
MEKTYTLEEIVRLLKNVQSKKCRSKAMNRTVALQEALKEEQRLLEIKKTLETSPKTKNLDIDSMTLVEINKEIKNVQSKKCLAKFMDRKERQLEMIELEERLKVKRAEIAPKEQQVKVRTKLEIIDMIKTLETLKTKESKAQIEILKQVLNIQA